MHDLDRATNERMPVEGLAHPYGPGDRGSSPSVSITRLGSYSPSPLLMVRDFAGTAMAGGAQALIEHPEELQRLRDDPGLLDSTVDEIIRWTTPVKYFMRTTTDPNKLSVHRFEPGDRLLLPYPSANRDEHVFDDPFRFDVGRSPNNHLAFGFGAHY